MTALTTDRNSPQLLDDIRSQPVAAASKIFAGSIVMRNAAGYMIKGQTVVGGFGTGRAEDQTDNSAGALGAINVRYRKGTFQFANSTAGDLIAQANVGAKCWIVDDQTVALTNGTATRSPAGIIEGVDAFGVWVLMDENINRAT